MENNYTQLSWQIRGKALSAVLSNGELWFTQKTIGYVLGVTQQAVCLQLQDFDFNKPDHQVREFRVVQAEGGRMISRVSKHYSLATAYAVANDGRRTEYLTPALDLARQHVITVEQFFVTLRKEYQFQELMTNLLSGIVTVVPQYRTQGYVIDFYIPDLNLGIEYDETPHESPKQKARDNQRQHKLESSVGMRFLRVQEGRELDGLNAILRVLVPLAGLQVATFGPNS